MFFVFVVFALILAGVLIYVVTLPFQILGKKIEKATRPARKQREFEEKLKLIVAEANQKREGLAKETLLRNTRELASIVNEELESFKQELPPRVYEEIKESMGKFVENSDFTNLHSLYNTLLATNNKTVLHDLSKFAK